MAKQRERASSGLIDLVKQDGRIEVLATLSDRLILRLPTNLVETHADLKRVRGKDPDIALLRKSVAETKGPIYWVSLYVEAGDIGPHYYLNDGRQRYRAAIESKQTEIIAQWLPRWTTVEIAMAEAMSLNAARYEMTDGDIFSILETDKLTVKQVADHSGRSEDTIERFKTLVGHTWLREAIADGVIGYTQAAKLIKASDNNGDKLAALKVSFEQVYHDRKAEADRIAQEIKTKPRKWSKDDKAKAKVSTYFRNYPWGDWADAVESGHIQDGKLDLQQTTSTKAPVRIGSKGEWDKEFAVYGLFGAKHDEVETSDLADVIRRKDEIFRNLETIYKRRLEVDAKAAHPVTTENVVREEAPPPPPAEQQPPKIRHSK
jgi:hypothetical protein